MAVTAATSNLTIGNFHEILDNRGKPYFFYAAPLTHYTANTTGGDDICSFLHEGLNVTKRRTHVFSADLTKRDDVLIAVMSLLLLLVIEGLVTTVLLRSSAKGTISKSNFTIQHMVELVRDLRFREVARPNRRRVSYGLIVIALMFCVSTFALEVLVLFLTDTRLRPVSNSKVALRLIHPLIPEWIHVRFHQQVSINRACVAVSLAHVEQETTSISTCLVSTLPEAEYIFEEQQGEVDYRLETWIHDYGEEHIIEVDGQRANYSARAFFELQDGEERLMSRKEDLDDTHLKEQVYLTHKMYIGFLMTSYSRAIKAKARVTIDMLRQLSFETKELKPEDVYILKRSDTEGFLTARARRFQTKVTAPNVGANVSLAYAQSLFKASIGIIITDADENDAMMSSGSVREMPSVIWGEEARVLNWLALLLTLLLAGLLLFGLRFLFRPVAVEDLASMYVRGSVGAEAGRGPLRMQREERKWFYVGSARQSGSLGAGMEDISFDEDYDEETSGTMGTVGTLGTADRYL